MATKKAGGSTKNGRDSGPKYLGTKLYAGEKAGVGSIIIRQRGLKILPGKNIGIGRDHTLFALKEGIVEFSRVRKTRFDGTVTVKRAVNVK